jgi:hypothetical protein
MVAASKEGAVAVVVGGTAAGAGAVCASSIGEVRAIDAAVRSRDFRGKVIAETVGIVVTWRILHLDSAGGS